MTQKFRGKTIILDRDSYIKFNVDKKISIKYDTIVLINLLNQVDNYEDVLVSLINKLKKGGKIFGTTSSFAEVDNNIWGFTTESIKYILEKVVGIKNTKIKPYGNVLSGRYFINNNSEANINFKSAQVTDIHFPVIIGFSLEKIDDNKAYLLNIQKDIVVDEEKKTIRGFIASILKRSNNFLDKYINLIRLLRSTIMRIIKTTDNYLKNDSVEPISKIYGFDRGIPIDRYYIEKFMDINKKLIKGKCLEIVDNKYTIKYGGKKVKVSDVLDIFPSKKANIQGDLRNLKNIKSNTYDTLIITQTYNVIDDYVSAIKESHRILKKGGALLITLPTISPCWNITINMWRFSKKSLYHVLEKYFDKKNIMVNSFGNKKAAESFWIGMSQEDLDTNELNETNGSGTLIVGAVVKK